MTKFKESKTIDDINDKEKKLIELIRGIEYGELKVIIQNKKPIRIEELKKSIKL